MAKTIMCAATIWLLTLMQAVICPAQQSSTPTTKVAPPLIIASGDLIEVNMFDAPELSGRFRVDEKGDITVPLLGRVHVEGETAEEIGTAIEQRYTEAEILRPANAHATVFVTEYATQGILVNGEVKSPGLFPALGVRMLVDVMTAAGGPTPFASSKVVITRKTDQGNPITVDYNPEALIPLMPQVQIFPGDMITVPKAGSIYVLGDVNRPGVYVLEGRQALTVERAMGLAGGGARAAALKRVHLVRTVEGGRKEEIILSMDRIYKGKDADVAMKDGDVLYVPTSTAKLVTVQAISSALGIGTQVVTYKVAY